MTDFPARNKPPHDITVINRWLTQVAGDTGAAAGRLRRWLGFMVLAGMLDQVRHAADGAPLFLVKGGVAMELRARSGARATKDFDTALRHDIDGLADQLDPALRAGYGDFTATRSAFAPVKDTGAIRSDIKVAYRGKSFITVQMEVAEAEAGMGSDFDLVPALPLDHVGISGPDTVACVAVRWQIAQKLHACTETFPSGENDRFRDLLDLQLLEALVSDDDWPGVGEACIAVFTGRAKHGWPPTVTVYPSWELGYRAMAEEVGYPITSVSEAADAVRGLIARTDSTVR